MNTNPNYVHPKPEPSIHNKKPQDGQGASSSKRGGEPLPDINFPSADERPCYRLYETPFIGPKRKRYEAGVYYHVVKEEEDHFGNQTETFVDYRFLSPFEVTAILRTKENREHSYLIRYIPHGETQWQTDILSQSLLVGRSDEALKFLRDIGVSVLLKNVKIIRRFLDEQHQRFSSARPDKFWTLAQTIGWHDENTFVLPGKIIGEQTQVWYNGRNTVKYEQKGSLEKWQSGIANQCISNPYLLFGLSVAFAGPLLELLSIPGIGFHLYGYSTSGKTTSLIIANSVWFHPKVKTWNSTINALEGIAADRSSTLIALDESHLADIKHLDAAIYMLLDGSSKGRMKPDTTARTGVRWIPSILSSGERSLETHLSTKYTIHKAGQAVRIIDLCVPPEEKGVFDSVPPDMTPHEFADCLQKTASENYGWAGPIFIERLIENFPLLSLQDRLASLSKEMTREVLSAQERRVLRSFAVVALAGTLATEFAILPWQIGGDNKSNIALDAAKKMFELWLKNQPGGGYARERAQAIRNVREFIETHLDSIHFSDIQWRPSVNKFGDEEKTPIVNERYGYWEDINTGTEDEPVYKRMALLTSAGMHKAIGNLDFNQATETLKNANVFFDVDDKKIAKVRRVPGGGTLRLYHVNPEKLEQ
jgi:putative DNA primase/helicase